MSWNRVCAPCHDIAPSDVDHNDDVVVYLEPASSWLMAKTQGERFHVQTRLWDLNVYNTPVVQVWVFSVVVVAAAAAFHAAAMAATIVVVIIIVDNRCFSDSVTFIGDKKWILILSIFLLIKYLKEIWKSFCLTSLAVRWAGFVGLYLYFFLLNLTKIDYLFLLIIVNVFVFVRRLHGGFWFCVG